MNSKKSSRDKSPSPVADQAPAHGTVQGVTSVYPTFYPDIMGLLQFKYPSIGDVSGQCNVMLDANALLAPYHLSGSTLADIREVYQPLAATDRLFVPAHALREFVHNRGRVMGVEWSKLGTTGSSFASVDLPPMLESLPEFSTAEALAAEITKKEADYRNAVRSLRDRMLEWQWNDPVTELYTELLTTGVIVDHDLDEATLLTEMKKRYGRRQPPGYTDAGKSVNPGGDLMVWLSVLALGRRRKNHLLLVSNDAKEDWWDQVKEGGAFRPRFELIDEYRRTSGGHAFFMMPFSTFLRTFGAKEALVEEIERSEEAASGTRYDFDRSTRLGDGLYSQALFKQKAIAQWLVKKYPDGSVTRAAGPFDFYVHRGNGDAIGVTWRIAPRPSPAPQVREWLQMQLPDFMARRVSNTLLVLEVSSAADVPSVAYHLIPIEESLRSGQGISIVTDEGGWYFDQQSIHVA